MVSSGLMLSSQKGSGVLDTVVYWASQAHDSMTLPIFWEQFSSPHLQETASQFLFVLRDSSPWEGLTLSGLKLVSNWEHSLFQYLEEKERERGKKRENMNGLKILNIRAYRAPIFFYNQIRRENK